MEAKLRVTVADTPSKQAKGLMFVREMPRDRGMLFSFSKSDILSFWGQNTYIPLDIAFADEDGVISNIEMIKPLSLRPVKSSSKCMYAVEANAGYFDEHGIGIGDKIVFAEEGEELSILSFRKKTDLSRYSMFGSEAVKKAQLMGNEYGFDINDAQREEEEQARSRYESLPVVSPENVGDILVDQEFEDTPQQFVDQPSDMPEPKVPETDLPPVEPSPEPIPEFDNVFDAIDEYAKPTVNNDFMGSAMRIDYTTKSGKSIARDIEPHGTFHADTTGNEILVTYDRTAGGIRAFIMQNIKAFALLDDKFEPKFRVEG
tara:strand:+ start:28465 stop:29412 length:948 start_codon:yes stop_codon:yes gene_type:complete